MSSWVTSYQTLGKIINPKMLLKFCAARRKPDRVVARTARFGRHCVRTRSAFRRQTLSVLFPEPLSPFQAAHSGRL